MKIELIVKDATPDQVAAIFALAGASVTTTTAPLAVPASMVKPLETSSPAATNPAPVTSGAPLDSRGFPWDERIHSASKEFNKDGSWRYRRNTDKELIKSVEAELKGASVATQTTQQPAMPTFTPPAPVSTAPGVVDPGPIPPFLQRQPAPAPTAADAIAALSAPQPQPAPAPAVQPATYDQVIAMMTTALQNGKIAPDGVPAFFGSIGLQGVHQLQGNQTALDAAREKLTALGV